MEASRITFTKETFNNLNNPLIKGKRKTKLRREAIINYIKSKPNGALISAKELCKVAHFTGNGKSNLSMFVRRMEKDKLINIESIPNTYKRRYYVVGDQNLRLSGDGVATPRVPFKSKEHRLDVPPPYKSDGGPVDRDNTSSTLQDIEWVETQAKQFAWSENSDSLREFIQYIIIKERS